MRLNFTLPGVVILLGFTAHTIEYENNLRTMIGAQTASVEGSLALWQNPAGLAFMGGAETQTGYLYEWHEKGNRHNIGMDAAFSWLKIFSLGLGVQTRAAFIEKARSQRGTDLTGIAGTALRLGKNGSFGMSFLKSHNFLSEKSSNVMVAFGFQVRPWSFLSVGSHYQEIHDGYFKAPIITNGFSIRPYKEWFTLGLDGKWTPQGSSFKDGFLLHPVASIKTMMGGYGASINAEIPGLKDGFKKPIISAGIDLNLAHMGLSFGGIFNSAQRNYAAGGSLRMSSEEWPSIASPQGLWVSLTIDADGKLDTPPLTMAERFFALDESPLATLALLKRMESDRMIGGVVLHLNGFSFGDGRAQEWREAVLALRRAHKKVVIYLDAPSERDYYIATAADQILMNPDATLSLKNFQATLMYFADMLKKLGIKAEAVAAGSYKTAPRQWTNARPQKEEIEVMNNILNNFYEQLIVETATARTLDQNKLRALFGRGELTAKDAKEAGLVDALVFGADVAEKLDKEDYEKTYFPGYEHRSFKSVSWHNPKKIIIIPITDTIVDGRSFPGLLSGLFKRTYAKDIVDEIEAAVDDPDVMGIIIRVDSPGGDGAAAARITKALSEAQKIKPVVTSMSDVAASAGYMVASNTSHILALPNTITGSIGVFSLMFSGEELAKKVGIFTKELSPLKNPGATIARGLSKQEREETQKIIDWYYNNFIHTVSVGLDMDEADVKKYADGRVWLGSEALKHKLIHELGGFSKAVDSILLLTETPSDEAVELVIKNPGMDNKLTLGSRLLRAFSHDKLDIEVEHLAALAKPYIKALEAYQLEGKPQARLPFDIEWHHKKN